jgi:hypothetical protein
MSVEDVKAVIQHGRKAVDQARQMIEQVAVETTETVGAARATCHDSQHPEVQKALASLEQAIHETELTIRRLNASSEGAGRYLATLG